jgi:hypothetical protein
MPDRLHHVIEGGGACEHFMSFQLSALSFFASSSCALWFTQFNPEGLFNRGSKIICKIQDTTPKALVNGSGQKEGAVITISAITGIYPGFMGRR